MADCRNCGKKLSVFTLGDDPRLCGACRAERARQHKRFSATHGSDFFTDTLGPNKATWGLLAVNVIVFAAMVQSGVSVTEPRVADLIAKGANFGPKTIGEGEYWRLITQGFVHIGLFHLAMNMLCLWGLSRQLERFFGAFTTIAIYLLTAAGAGLLSLTYDPYRVSAGASGPIFGITGALVAFLYFGKHDLTAAERRAELNSTVRFALINLVIGFGGNIDNMAHLGGLVTGLLIGFALSRRRREDQHRVPVAILASAAAVIALLVAPVARAKKPMMDIFAAQDAYERKDFPAAIRLLRQRIARAPRDAGAHALLGYSLQAEKQVDAAIPEYKIALQLEPAIDWARMDLVNLYLYKRDFAAAEPVLAPLLEQQDADADVYLAQGQILAGLKDYRGAQAAFSRSVELADSSAAHAGLAEVYRAQNAAADAQNEERLATEAQAREAKQASGHPAQPR